MGAGFAAGFFGEATNIMRERSKNKREDELIAEERKQKELDWARQTNHDVEMATLRYDLEARDARKKEVEKAATLRTMYVQAGGDPTQVDKLLATDPTMAAMHIERALAIKDSNGLSTKAFADLTRSVGVEAITEDTATTYKTEIGSGATSTEAAFNSFALEDRIPAAPMKKEVIDLVSERLTAAALESANRRKAAIDSGNEEYRRISVGMEDAQKFGSPSALLKDVGVKAVYDTMQAMGSAGYDIRQHPDIVSNPALLQKVTTIADYKTFMGNPIESPYDAAAIFEQYFNSGEVDPTQKKALLDDYVSVYSVDFLPDSLLPIYYSYMNETPTE